MSFPWNILLNIPTRFVEAGLTVIDSTTRGIRTGLDVLPGAKPPTHILDQPASRGQRQLREASHGTSFGCLPTEQHFGLGHRDTIDALDIRWPSGLRQRFKNLAINQTIRIVEGESGYLPVRK